MATAIGLVTLFGYLVVRAFSPRYVWFDPYISPVVAPPLFTPATGFPGAVPVAHAWLGAFPSWWPPCVPASPAFFIPGIAMAFRFTCYYYRGAYYKALFVTPPACAVTSGSRGYRGETHLLIVQNLHRYTLYAAIFLLGSVWVESLSAFVWQGRVGVGVGSVVLIVNAALLTGYTFGCHSFRHLAGGRLDCFSCHRRTRPRYGLWRSSSWLNVRHQAFAWVSLVWVVLTDLYVRLVSAGVVHDVSTWRR
jgi:hypothetical protein